MEKWALNIIAFGFAETDHAYSGPLVLIFLIIKYWFYLSCFPTDFQGVKHHFEFV